MSVGSSKIEERKEPPMNDFEKLWEIAMSEATARLEALSDEEVERIINESNLAS
jgi:hypothetical protein